MSDNNTTTTDLVASLLKGAKGRHEEAMKAHADATALPKGTRGKASAIKLAEYERAASFSALTQIHKAISDANREKVMAWVASFLEDEFDPVVKQILAARKTTRHSIVALDLTAYSFGEVFAEVTYSSQGIPTDVEIRKLANRAETLATASRWLGDATTDEGKALAQDMLDNPDAYPTYSREGSLGSITITQAWNHGDDANAPLPMRYTLNASTWQAESDAESDEAWKMVGAASVIRRKLNAVKFPSESQIRHRLADIG